MQVISGTGRSFISSSFRLSFVLGISKFVHKISHVSDSSVSIFSHIHRTLSPRVSSWNPQPLSASHFNDVCSISSPDTVNKVFYFQTGKQRV